MATEIETETGTDVLAGRRGPALWLRLNRPATLNGLTPALLDELDAGLARAEADDAVRAVVLAGAGRAFCAGADLRFARELFADPTTAAPRQLGFLTRVGATFDRVEGFGKPVIAAVHGLALAGGLELALCADLVVAARSARFGDAHATYGLLPGGGASVRLPRRVGRATAKYLMFTGDPVPAAELAHTDLVTRLVDDQALTDEVDRIVAVIAARSPLGLARMKRLVDDALDAPPAQGLRREIELAALHTQSHDFREGLDAFAAKRPPEFTGQ